MKDVHLIIHRDEKATKGIRFEISDYWVAKVRQELTDSGMTALRAIIGFVLPESKNTRKFLMGGLIPLQVYLDGNDHRDSDLCEWYFEEFGKDRFPEAVKRNGKVEIKRKSSKGRNMLGKYTESFIEYLHEEYGVSESAEVLNTANYKRFMDELYSTGKWEDYLSYAKDMKWLEFNRITK
jgi:hypothetical protein